jgi:hypothetical protein
VNRSSRAMHASCILLCDYLCMKKGVRLFLSMKDFVVNSMALSDRSHFLAPIKTPSKQVVMLDAD